MNYKLAIEPYVYFNLKKNSLLFYNTFNGDVVKSSAKEIVDFFLYLQSKGFEIGEVKSKEIDQFINNLEGKLMISRLSYDKVPPLNFFQNNHDYIVNDLKKIKTNSGVDSISHIKKLNFQINSFCNHNCKYCDYAYKQFDSCVKKGSESISFNQFTSIISQVYKNTEITLLGGNVLQHPDLLKFLRLLKEKKYLYVNVLINSNSVSGQLQLITELSKYARIIILSDHEQIDYLNKQREFYLNKDVSLSFIIKSEQQYNEIQERLDIEILQKADYKVLFDNNLNFFQENVYTDESDLFEGVQSLKEIRTKRLINTNFYGRLSILSNGDVYFNYNKPKVSNIFSDNLNNIVSNELREQKIWFMKRNQVEPCSKCIYADLCPAISNYELFIGQNNSCKFRITENKWG